MATLIRTSRLSETSLIVHWCSQQKGLIKTAAKGALRPKSQFSGKLDLFFEAELVYIPSRTSDLHTLKEVSVVKPRDKIRNAYLNTLAAAFFVRWIEKVSERETPIPEFADLLRRALDYLDDRSPTLKAVLHFENQLARMAGVAAPDISPAQALAQNFGSIPEQRDELMRHLEAQPPGPSS